MSLSYKGENIPEMYGELLRLRAKLERAREGFSHVIRAGSKGFDQMELVRIAEVYERELENGGGDE